MTAIDLAELADQQIARENSLVEAAKPAEIQQGCVPGR
jgi:hypothetical protein